LLSEIKAEHPGLPVIVITGHGSEAVCARALKLGARDYFTKPLALAELLRSVRLILSASSSQTHPRSNVLSTRAVSQAMVPRTGHAGIDLAVRVIHEQCEKKLTLGAIARAAETGLFSLSRNFTAVMGTSFRAYLLRVRVERAVELLKDQSLSVAEVADRAGFPDPSWFNKVFRRHRGVSPSVYRKRRVRKRRSARRTRFQARNS
jgi:YesN/AraC family two-component response regulator